MFFPTVKTAPLPDNSILWALYQSGDFIDGYRIQAPYPPRRAAEIAMKFPRWVYALLALRQIVVSPFNLKGKGLSKDSISIFPVTQETEDEIILGFNDRHLNFRIAILSKGPHLYCATWVHRHNWLGRAYLFVVMPFHILITKQMLARVARQAQAELA